MFTNYLQKFEQILHCIECDEGRQKKEIAYLTNEAVAYLSEIKDKANKVMWIGNGGSAAIASHGAIDYWRTGEIKSVCFNDGALLSCIGNDFGYSAVFQKAIEMFADPGDLLVSISSSGQSENIINGVRTAREKGCKIITLSGFLPENPLRMLGDLNFYVPSKHYGHVELAHGIICHSFLDIYMAQQKGKSTW